MLDGFGGADKLRLGEIEPPVPAPDQILIDVRAAAVNRPDIIQREGRYPPPPGESPILGLECAGTVAAVGRTAMRHRVGDRVFALLGGAIFQILLLDLVFSVDSIITAVGMTDHLAIMYIAVIFAITVMMVAATPLADFIERNPTIVMLALGFLLMIGTTLIADGFGFHVPKGYIYTAMAFSALVEGLNMLARRRAERLEQGGASEEAAKH